MNKTNIQQIFAHYIDKFDYINDDVHDENYKWYVAARFRTLMDEALQKTGQVFADALLKVQKCTENIIDSRTQPFYGLVECARKEPDTVRQMFADLLRVDDTDIENQMERIRKFFEQSSILLSKYFEGSFLYRHNSHSVSAYLFLYDPYSHYLYKYEQSKAFADCIGFYDDWGTGDNIKLDVYYRMCDWIVDQIMGSEELLTTDESRFEMDKKGEMFPDENKHLLAFDLIYCCFVYDLFDGISYNKLNAKEKNLFLEKRKAAQEALTAYNKAEDDKAKLDEAVEMLGSRLHPGMTLQHKKYGAGEIFAYSMDKDRLTIRFAAAGEKELSASVIFANGIVKLDDPEAEEAIKPYASYLKRLKNIYDAYNRARADYERQSKYLD